MRRGQRGWCYAEGLAPHAAGGAGDGRPRLALFPAARPPQNVPLLHNAHSPLPPSPPGRCSETALNGEIGSKYVAKVYKAGTTTLVDSFDLSTQGPKPWTQVLPLPAGKYQLIVESANVNGDGEATNASPEFDVGACRAGGTGGLHCGLVWCRWRSHFYCQPHLLHCCVPAPLPPADVSTTPSIRAGSGSAAGAVLEVLRPDTVSDDDKVTYLIQAFSDVAGTVKVGHRVQRCACLVVCCAASCSRLRVVAHVLVV